MLGEAAHGNGHSDSFKSSLVEQLVTRCGFRAVLFESSVYEFVPIWRAKQARQNITPSMIGTAVGGLWKFDREFQPLLGFLARRASQGLFVGGVDFQIGGLEQDFANSAMILELTTGLSPSQVKSCRELSEARMLNGLTADQRTQATACISAIEMNISASKGQRGQEQRLMMSNLDAIFDAGFEHGHGPFIAVRDRQMFQNVQHLLAQLPRGTKTIIWTANAHAANGAPEESGFAEIRNLGSYIRQAYGSRSFALATTAWTGDQRWSKQHKPLPSAPAGSLEARTFGSGSTLSVFYDSAALKKFGPTASGIFGHRYTSADWWQRFDGVVVFREEHAAFSSRYAN